MVVCIRVTVCQAAGEWLVCDSVVSIVLASSAHVFLTRELDQERRGPWFVSD